ncbi:hypothetical protein pb186bvf_005090 [Paramecium bursaria]
MLRHIFFAILLIATTSQIIPEEGGVLVLSSQNFDLVLKRYEFLMIDFYATWCSHCIELAPIYSQAAKQVRTTNIQFAKIDCPSFQDICHRYGVRAFPTLIFFENGQMSTEYDAPRTAKDMIEWTRKKTNRGSVEGKTADQFKKFADTSSVSIAFFGENEYTPEFQAYIQYSRKFKAIPALHTFNQNIANELKVLVPSVVVYKPFDERKAVLSDDLSYESIAKFVKKNSNPIFMTFDIPTAKRVFGGEDNTLFLIQQGPLSQAEKQLRLASSKIRDQILISIANTDSKYGKRLMQYFGLGYHQLPKLVIFNPRDSSFNFLDDIQKENIISFVQNQVYPEHRTDL